MYIRKSMRSYKGRTYTNYVLVESVQTQRGRDRSPSVHSAISARGHAKNGSV